MLWVDGDDAERFLQGLLSNDIAALGPGESCAALFLNARGQIRAGMTVHRGAQDAFTLILDRATAARTARELEEFHFSEALEFAGPEPAERVAVRSDISLPHVDLETCGRIPGTDDLLVASTLEFFQSSGLAPLPSSVLELARIDAGIARVGQDTGERTLVHEAALEASAVSFSKGCYLGQETVARTEHRGGVRRRLARLFADAPVARGATITRDGHDIGTLTSVAGSPEGDYRGLAIIREGSDSREPVDVAGVVARAEPV